MRFRTLEEMESAKGRQTNSIQKEARRNRAAEGHLFQGRRVFEAEYGY